MPPDVFVAVGGLVPRQDRDLESPVFRGVEQGALRREMARACKAAGIPLLQPARPAAPPDQSLHLQGISWAQIGSWAGQGSKLVTADTYTHVLVYGDKVDQRPVLNPGSTSGGMNAA